MTTTEMEKAQPVPGYLQSAADEWGAHQARILRDTIANDLNAPEFALFVEVCRAKKLDPFSRQIHAVKRGNRMVIQTGIDGYRTIAQRTKEYRGQGDAEWWDGTSYREVDVPARNPDGSILLDGNGAAVMVRQREEDWVKVWPHAEHPFAARATVFRAGFVQGLKATALWSEYADLRSPMWKPDGFPSLMLAKCAEALALRKAFPEELSGIYTDEEMAQANARDVVGHEVPTEPVPAKANAVIARGAPEQPKQEEPPPPPDEDGIVDAEFTEPEKPAAAAEPRGPSGPHKSSSSALLEFCGIVDELGRVQDLDTTVDLWADVLKELKHGEAYAKAWATQRRAELAQDDTLIGLKDDDDHQRMLGAIRAMRANRADAQGA